MATAASLLLAALAPGLIPQEASPPAVPSDASAAPAAPAVPTASPIRQVILITLDTVRADKLGCYGYFRDTSPNLDRFAEQCVRYDRCLAPVSNTTPSHASMLTGVDPHEHGILNNFFNLPAQEQVGRALRTSPSLRSFAEAATAAGVRTGGFVAATPVKRSTGLSVGFAEWTEPPPKEPRRIGKTVIADALEFLASVEESADSRAFAWLHFFDVHGPIRPPLTPPTKYTQMYRTTPELQRWITARGAATELDSAHAGPMPITTAHNLYDGCLRFLDDQLGPLLDRLSSPERRADTMVLIVGDHGHGLGQHDYLSHGLAWDEHLRVPLLIRAPDLGPGVVETLCSTIDLVPTILARAPGFADASFHAQLRGRDVLSPDLEARPLVANTAAQAPNLTLTTTRWKLVRAIDGSCQLFDLEADPFELTDVAAANQPLVKQLMKVLLDEIDRQKRRRELHRHGAGESASAIDPQVLLELKALGYTEDGAEASDDPAGSGAPDERGASRADGDR
jgi:arylsulfatase A-like enzyme